MSLIRGRALPIIAQYAAETPDGYTRIDGKLYEVRSHWVSETQRQRADITDGRELCRLILVGDADGPPIPNRPDPGLPERIDRRRRWFRR